MKKRKQIRNRRKTDKPFKYVTKEEHEEIVTLRAENFSWYKIAVILNRSRMTITRYAEKNGLKPVTPYYSKFF